MADQKERMESTEVSWPLDGTTVYGTLVRPDGEGPFPAIVMVAGSGPTDRDWNTPLLPGSNGSARLMAEALAAQGFASLRYDKRAAGPHVQENLPALAGKISFQSHLDELAGAVELLAGQDFVDPARLFALSSSEGGLHALNYQVHDPAQPFAGLVLTGLPGRPMAEVGRAQIAAQVTGLPDAEARMAAYDAAIGNFLAGDPVVPDPALPQGAQMLLQALATPANLPFSRELWAADAAPWLARVQAPVLVVIGQKDIQVDWRADGAPLQRAAEGHPEISFLFPENANHVLKYEPRPREALAAVGATDYNKEGTRLDPEALAGIIGWLESHT